MISKQDRLKALEDALHTIVLKTVPNVPGAVIKHLSKDIRNKLKELKSDDIAEVSKEKIKWLMTLLNKNLIS